MALSVSAVAKMVGQTDKIITEPYTKWLLEYGDSGYPPHIAEMLFDEFKKVPRNRSGSFSASSAGTCLRSQVLSYLGSMKIHDIDPVLQNLFSDGKWRHLRWQANLMSAGILTEIEARAEWRKMRALGSLDGKGIVPNNHRNTRWRNKTYGFELKGVNPFAYTKIVDTQESMTLPAIKEEHKRQVHRYFLMDKEIELFVIVYENKATQEWLEWVIEPDDEYIQNSRRELIELNKSIDDSRLPPMLPECKKGSGPTFMFDCPFGTMSGPCVRTVGWPANPRKLKRKR